MKIYEKPMANIEKLNVEDVITASAMDLSASENAAVLTTLNDNGLGANNTIVFQW